jgi:hypothetical protein
MNKVIALEVSLIASLAAAAPVAATAEIASDDSDLFADIMAEGADEITADFL